MSATLNHRDDGTFAVLRTAKFSSLELAGRLAAGSRGIVLLELECAYTSKRVSAALAHNPGRWTVIAGGSTQAEKVANDLAKRTDRVLVHWREYGSIPWAPVLSGEGVASSYCVRKGISRKAQLWLACRRYFTKHAASVLKAALPDTLVLETWEAFDEDLKVNFGDGDIAGFGADVLTVGQRLALCLSDASDAMAAASPGTLWIAKPSYANKGAEIQVLESFEQLSSHLQTHHTLREWVLQRYIPRPLLVQGRKFHLRAYVLCVGSLSVFFFNEVLLLSAQRPLAGASLKDRTAHLTNTAVAAELSDFDEAQCVKLLVPDLALELDRINHPCTTAAAAAAASSQNLKSDSAASALAEAMASAGVKPSIGATTAAAGVMAQMHVVTAELFRAYQGEFSSFQPLPNCFEHFGLDFMVSAWRSEARR